MLRTISLTFLLFVVAQLSATPLKWQKVTTFGEFPIATLLGVLGYYDKGKQLIYFGGIGNGQKRAETYLCNITGPSGGNVTCTWSKVNTTTDPGPRFFHYSGVCESEEIFVIAAGQDDLGENLNDIWYFSFATNNWYEVNATGPIPGLRYAGGSGVVPGTCDFFLTMGFGGTYRNSDTFTMNMTDVTQTSAGEWKLLSASTHSYNPSAPHSRCLTAGTFLTDSTFAIFGGCLNNLGVFAGGPCPSWDSWYFDLTSNSWHQLPNCLAPRRIAQMSTLPDNPASAVLYGGYLDNSKIATVLTTHPADNEVNVLDLTTPQKWFRIVAEADPINGVPTWRRLHSMITGYGLVFMYGGSDGSSKQELWTLSGDYTENQQIPCPHLFFTSEMAHGILMFLAWGICFQAGAVIARYAKFANPLWFYLHISFQLTGLLLASAGFAFAFLNKSNPLFPHAIIGIIAMGLALWQPINGLFRPEHKKGEKDSILRCMWYFLHMLTGRFSLLLGLVNISLGLFLIVSPRPIWIIWFVFLFCYVVFLVVMETIYWVRYYRNKGSDKQEKKE